MPKSLLIEDFTGGRSTLNAMNQIAPNQLSEQKNVWTENNALSQRRGFTTTVINVSSISLIPEQLKETQMGASSLLRLIMVSNATSPDHNQRYLVTTDDGSAFAFAGYRAGTVSTAGSSTTVTGASTVWSGNVAVGDYFIPSGGAANRITAVNSNTEIVVTTAVNLSAGTGYKIIQAIVEGSPCGMELFDVSGAQNFFLADGTRVYRYDGTDVFRADNAYSMPAFKMLAKFKNYLFGILHNTTAIRWSALANVTSWPTANTQTITTVADPMRGMFVYNDQIIIFTRGRMFRLLGDVFDPSNVTYALQQISTPPNFNFYFSRSPAVHQGILKFLASDGWYAYAGGMAIEKISNIIQPEVDGFRRLVYASEAMQDSAVSFVFKERLWCSVPDDDETPTQNVNTIYVQDERGAWWKWPMAAGSAAGEISDFAAVKFGVSGAYQLLGGNVGTNKISVLDTGNSDDGSAISGTADTKEFVFPREVDFLEAYVTMKKQSAGNLIFGFSIDRAAFVSKTCSMTAGVGTVIRKKVPIARTGKSIRFQVSNSTNAQTFEVYSIELIYEPSDADRI